VNLALWILQILMAGLFLFAGAAKFFMSAEELAKGPVQMSLAFLRFIGVAEVLGGLGLILPGVFRIRTRLTALAAVGLLIVMIGATALTWSAGMMGVALFNAVIGVLCALIAYGRWRLAPLRGSSGRSTVQPAH
jgi:uncharacterized membrane protein YphA (DoxX/SURF4 family)